MNSIIITRAGTHSTIQDFGRFQYQHLGVSPSGAMDQRIITELQKIIPNHQNQFLEFAYVGPSIKVKEGSVKICIGGNCNMSIQKDNKSQLECQPYKSINLFEGDELIIHNTIDSVYGYIAFEHGLGLEPCLNSYSTDTKAGIGSINRPLHDEDIFHISKDVSSWDLISIPKPDLEKVTNFKVYPGPQLQYFSDNTLQSFISGVFTITNQSDRMGIRLKGESLISSKSHDILSEGILPGSIQVPSDGQPIVLMRDIPCTGGYPKIAILNEVDISRISQLPPETKITFDLQKIY